MYEDHYQVFDDPFRFTPDEYKPFQHHSYLSGVAFLQHVLDHSRKVLILIYGETGVGKSTLVNDILRRQDTKSIQTSTVKASNVNSSGVMQSIIRGFDLDDEGSEEKLINQLNDYLSEKSSQNQYSLFVIEAADELSAEALNQLGQLVRLIWDNRYKMKIFLIGSPILDQLLYQSKNEALQKKILIGWNQHGIAENEIGGYIAHRISNVGGVKLSFEDVVWRTLYDFSDGIPRRINRICNKLLLNGYFEKKLSFVNADIMDAVRQLDNEGLLEVKKSFATMHGLKGTSNRPKEDGLVMNVKSFANGFAEPLMVKKFISIEETKPSPLADVIAEVNRSKPDVKIKEAKPEIKVKKAKPVERKQDIPELNESFLNVNMSIDKEDFHPMMLEADKPSWWAMLMEWRALIVVSVLGLIGVLVLFNSGVLDTETRHRADFPKVIADTDETIISKAPAIVKNKTKSSEDLIATNVPPTPQPEAASDRVESQGSINEPVAPVDAANETNISNTNNRLPLEEDFDVDETGQVEELARIDQERNAIVSPGAESSDSSQLYDSIYAEQAESAPLFTTRQLKKMLLSGFWTRSGRPAVLLPSELNTCTEGSKDIFCRSTNVKKQAGNKTITSRTGAMFHQFTGDGTFNVAYRRGASIKIGKVTSPSSLKEYTMSCRFLNKSQVECIQNGVLVQFVRRFKLDN